MYASLSDSRSTVCHNMFENFLAGKKGDRSMNALPIEDMSKTYIEHSMVIDNFVINSYFPHQNHENTLILQ